MQTRDICTVTTNINALTKMQNRDISTVTTKINALSKMQTRDICTVTVKNCIYIMFLKAHTLLSA